jgi:hypothetical protein
LQAPAGYAEFTVSAAAIYARAIEDEFLFIFQKGTGDGIE